MATVKIKGKKYNIENSFRSMLFFEKITGKPFKIESMTDHLAFLYSVLLACNREKEDFIDFDEFLDILDKDKELYEKINSILAGTEKVERLVEEAATEGDDKKKGSR